MDDGSGGGRSPKRHHVQPEPLPTRLEVFASRIDRLPHLDCYFSGWCIHWGYTALSARLTTEAGAPVEGRTVTLASSDDWRNWTMGMNACQGTTGPEGRVACVVYGAGVWTWIAGVFEGDPTYLPSRGYWSITNPPSI